MRPKTPRYLLQRPHHKQRGPIQKLECNRTPLLSSDRHEKTETHVEWKCPQTTIACNDSSTRHCTEREQDGNITSHHEQG
ncbi:hypothetical protein DPMN_098617 [Dreissena polymorpha]|uniref:Uncharacterized protein n=1 Tax=Dreissena polymorpha TaxID=45954 RepID=A0A9D4R6V8_DREPO|nr:hypothetical protein DPMN_098617 [Dreissena polymorpha]